MSSYVDKTAMFSMLGIVIAMVALLIVRGPITDSWAAESNPQVVVNDAAVTAGDSITLDKPAIFVTPEGNYANTHIPIKGFNASGKDANCKRSNFSSTDGVNVTSIGAIAIKGTDNTCTISYQTEDTESEGYVTLLLQLLPFLIVAGVVAGTTLVRGARARSGFSSGGTGFGMGQAISLIIALVLLPIISKFTTDATDAYAVIPSYFGVGLMLGLVILGYVLGIILDITGQLGPGAMGKIREMRGRGSRKGSM